MRVGDSANVSEGFVEDEMSWKIRGRPEFPLNHVAREIGHNQIFRTHLVIGDTTRPSCFSETLTLRKRRVCLLPTRLNKSLNRLVCSFTYCPNGLQTPTSTTSRAPFWRVWRRGSGKIGR